MSYLSNNLGNNSFDGGEPYQADSRSTWENIRSTAKSYATNAGYILGIPTSSHQLYNKGPIYASRAGAIAGYTAKLLYDNTDDQPCTASTIASAALKSTLAYTTMHIAGTMARRGYVAATGWPRGRR